MYFSVLFKVFNLTKNKNAYFLLIMQIKSFKIRIFAEILFLLQLFCDICACNKTRELCYFFRYLS